MKRRLNFLLFALLLCGLLPCAKATPAFAETAEQIYDRVARQFREALAISHKQRKMDALYQCITQLQNMKSQNGNAIQDKCHYLTAQCYHYRYDTLRRQADLTAAFTYYRLLVKKFPQSPLADDALFLAGVLLMDTKPDEAYDQFSRVVTEYPQGDMKPKADRKMAELEKAIGMKRLTKRDAFDRPKGKPDRRAVRQSPPPQEAEPTVVELDRIQHWSVNDYTRVVLYLSGPAAYEQNSAAPDPKKRRPGTVQIRIGNCRLDSGLKERIRLTDTILKEIHATQADPTTVQVVLSTEAVDTYRVFSMQDPSRLIVDVRGKKPARPAEERKPAQPRQEEAASSAMPSLARQLALEVKRIVLDPGHGGRDKGATSPWGIHEKDVTLALARALKKTLETRTGCEVILTRTRDRYLSLEERTAIANAQKADLFISIHTNAHEDRNLCGVETYFLNLARDKESARVAAFENATSTRKISDLEAILHDLMLSTKVNESAKLAAEVQARIVSRLRMRYDTIRDLGTKQAPFYVLLGAEMPSILIETAFITNQREERRLRDRHFQEYLASAIANGVESFIRRMKETARAGERP